MEFLVLLLCYLIGLVVVLLITVPIHQKHIEVTHNIVNYDTFMRHFVFKIPLTAEQILDRLKIPNVFDELEYKLDLENSMITFLKDHEELSFWLEFQQLDGFCILLLHQRELSYERQYLLSHQPVLGKEMRC